MKTIISEKIPRILKAKEKLVETLNVKITNRGKEVTIKGKPEDEYTAEKVIDAINLGFPISHALEIKTMEMMFEVLNIKDYTKRTDLERIRGRIIGTKGKTLKTITDLTNSHIEMLDNKVGIIGPPESIELAQNAIISIVHGSKTPNVYASIERNQPKLIDDLGLKE